RREVEHEVGRVFVRKRKPISEDEPPLGVGVADLDGKPLAAREDVAWPHRRRRYRVLDDWDDDPEANIEPRLHDEPRQRQRRRRAAHVLFHQFHSGRRLDVEAAGVERDALADERDFRRVRASWEKWTIRGSSAAARPTAWMSGKLSARSSSPRTMLTLASKCSASLTTSCSSARGPSALAGVLTRSRP